MAVNTVISIRSRYGLNLNKGWIVEVQREITDESDAELHFSSTATTILNHFIEGIQFTRSWCKVNEVPDKIVVMNKGRNGQNHTTYDIQDINDDGEIALLMLKLDLAK